MSGGGLSGNDKVLNLVGAIYDASLDTQLWPDILNKIGDAIGGPLIVFGIYDPAIGLVNMHAPRTDPEIMRSLVDWAATNPVLPCIASYPPGKVFNGADVISPDEFTGTRFIRTGGGRPVSVPSPSSPTCLPIAGRRGTLPATGYRIDLHWTVRSACLTCWPSTWFARSRCSAACII